MPDIRLSNEIHHRVELPLLLTRKGLLGTAAELGVHRGDFAALFLNRWPGKEYLCIDHYQDYSSLGLREIDRKVAHVQLARYGDRVKWIQEDSTLALRALPRESLDFVYIDAEHLEWAVAEDILAAWPRIRPGGILAGHDFDRDFIGTVFAVRAFAERENVTIHLTSEGGIQWSWYCYKKKG